ncbi:MAG: esterase-like activity of phytase family protein [Burkholderiaceae bacterium]|nr:esterase-like activity of phytase family protein [Burkholderiaceae bacterium]
MKKTLIARATGVVLSGLLVACGGDGASGDLPSVSQPGKFFNRTATFAVCSQVGASCEDNTPTAAEIVAASEDGMTLVYTNSLKGEIGFVDIVDPANPKPLGRLDMGGEPTSVTVLGAHALVAVNTSQNFTNVSGKLVVVDMAQRSVVTEIQLGGQPDSVARSKDGRYVAVVIENERDETLGNGAPPQAPSGYLTIVDTVGAPSTWKTRVVDLKGLAALYPEDAEPEYVSINDDNVAVVTMQENNHLVLVDLPTGKVVRHFSAGAVTLTQVDLTDAPRPNLVSLTQTQANRLREPDGVTWFSKTQFATANEGDLNGGSRGFSIFHTDGTVAYDAGNTLEHLVARIGHTNDKRSDAKGNEPENVAFGRFEGTDYLFVASERSSVVAVYDMGQKNQPVFKQVLPAALAPEGVLAIPSRNLLIAASENDDRATSPTLRSALNIYQYQSAPAAYPTIQSVNRADGTPIPWSALSGLVAAPTGSVVYGIDDSFFRGNRIFEIDTSAKPASLRREIRITDPNGKIAALAAVLPAAKDANAFDATDLAAMVNADGSVNLDPEGIALASSGGFWIASEGAGTVGEAARPVLTANLVFKLSATGVIEEVIQLPADVNARQQRFGFEGIAESNGKLVVAFQRAWAGETQPRIGVYDLAAKTWQFMFYPLDAVTSPNKGWVGLSDLTALGNNRFLVIERDNQGGPDARIKKLYRIDLTGVANGATLGKTLVRDVLPDLRTTKGLVVEKIEGLAVLANGEVLLVNDNDGVDENNGETWLFNLGKLVLN